MDRTSGSESWQQWKAFLNKGMTKYWNILSWGSEGVLSKGFEVQIAQAIKNYISSTVHPMPCLEVLLLYHE